MKYPTLILLALLALTACATSKQPTAQDNAAQLGEGNKDLSVAAFGAVSTTRQQARLHDINPGEGRGGTVLEPVVLWNPVTKTWEPQLDGAGNPIMKAIAGFRDYNNFIGSTISLSATGSGTTSGSQTQGQDSKPVATPTNDVKPSTAVTPTGQ